MNLYQNCLQMKAVQKNQYRRIKYFLKNSETDSEKSVKLSTIEELNDPDPNDILVVPSDLGNKFNKRR